MKNNSTHYSSETIINNYIIKQTIGKGTFGKVKLGIYVPTNEKVAIKILEKSKMVEKDDFERVGREMSIIQSLHHQNVIKIQDIFENEDNFYIVMEYCEGGELFNYMVKKRRLSDEEASFFYDQISNGLEYIHSKGVVHRDLKPENLLLGKDNILKIIDFGLSNYFEKKLLSTPCGSPCYASPEMVSGHKYNGFRIDIWSTGIILYAMLCGYLPFEDKDNEVLFKTILECNVDYPRCLSGASRDLMRKILVTNPDKRITIKEIKKHRFYLKGEKLFNMKFHPELTVTNSKPISMSYISNATSRCPTQRQNKEDSQVQYAPLQTETGTANKRFTINSFLNESIHKDNKIIIPHERRHETDITSPPTTEKKSILSKPIKTNAATLYKNSNRIKQVNFSAFMTLNSMRLSNRSPIKAPIAKKNTSISKKKNNIKSGTSHNHTLTTPNTPNSIMINNAVINLNMIGPKFIISNNDKEKNKQKRTKSSSVARNSINGSNDRRHLTLLSNFLQNKNEKIETAHQKYVSNICHTEVEKKSKENSRVNPKNEKQTNHKKFIHTFFDNLRPMYLNTEGNKTTINQKKEKPKKSVSSQKNKVAKDSLHYNNKNFNNRDKEFQKALKAIREQFNNLYMRRTIQKK